MLTAVVGALLCLLPVVNADDVPAAEAEGQLGLGVEPLSEPVTQAATEAPAPSSQAPWAAVGAYLVAYIAVALYVGVFLRTPREPASGGEADGRPRQ